MDTLNECLVIGLICMVLYHFVIKLIKKDKKKLNYRQNLILAIKFNSCMAVKDSFKITVPSESFKKLIPSLTSIFNFSFL